jgi:PAS domain-containing protein
MALAKDMEIIVSRHLASCLAMPIFIVDPAGVLLFYNEPAELILGRRFEETGEMPAEEWATCFVPTDKAGKPIPPQSVPLMIVLTERRPAHSQFWIRGLDGKSRHIEVVAFPLIGLARQFLGGMAIFWEVPPC